MEKQKTVTDTDLEFAYKVRLFQFKVAVGILGVAVLCLLINMVLTGVNPN